MRSRGWKFLLQLSSQCVDRASVYTAWRGSEIVNIRYLISTHLCLSNRELLVGFRTKCVNKAQDSKATHPRYIIPSICATYVHGNVVSDSQSQSQSRCKRRRVARGFFLNESEVRVRLSASELASSELAPRVRKGSCLRSFWECDGRTRVSGHEGIEVQKNAKKPREGLEVFHE